MTQITLRGMDPEIEREVRRLARKMGKSLNHRPRYGKKLSAQKLYGNTTASGNKTMFYYSIGQS